MGNGFAKVGHCFASSGDISRRHDAMGLYVGDPLHEGLGHSFCYLRPDPPRLSFSSATKNKIHSEETTTFRSISGASVSANTSTTPSSGLVDSSPHSSAQDRASAFESSDSFASVPLQPVPRGQSGPIERGRLSGFLSGPIERFLSGPIDRGFHSELIDDSETELRPKKQSGLIKTLRRALSSTISMGQKSFKAVRQSVSDRNGENENVGAGGSGSTSSSSGKSSDEVRFSSDFGCWESEYSMGSQNLQWAQGKAGEDRVQIVISEESGWVFVGIYDGFNGPDAPDYLVYNLYNNVRKELKGLLWNDKLESPLETEETEELEQRKSLNCRRKPKGKDEESQGRWKCEWDRERLELDRKLKEQLSGSSKSNSNGVNHSDVLKALSMALRKTEEAYLQMAVDNHALAMIGSCVLVMLMKGEDVYLMNVGDSRAVLAQKCESNLGIRRRSHDLGIINEESTPEIQEFDVDEYHSLSYIQLTKDHSTYVDKEVQRIRKEHADDASAVINDRVKGYLKVTRAFGVGFLKQPKWNDLLLEMFRIDYIGTSPYINCLPSLHHHRLSPKDRFLILSSDGLYQYFTNQEAVLEVESFIATFPEGDPAQHLIEELLFRAARKAGMDFHELLDIPQGERRRYHDDVSVIIISLEGRIWRSFV